MRRCSNGHDVADGEFQFCPICGERLEPAAAEPEPEESPPMVSEVSQAFGPSSTAAEAFGEPPPEVSPPAVEGASRKWPVSIGWTIVIAIFTLLTGLVPLLAIYLWRGGHKTAGGIIGAVFALFVVAVIAGLATGNSNDKSASPPTAPTTTAPAARKCSSYPAAQARPRGCISKTGIACSGYGTSKPNDCYSAAQLRSRIAAHKAQLIAARKARVAAAKARRLAAQRAAAAAKAAAAALAAENAWHQGYNQQDENVYWKWVNGQSCQDFATNGCWHVAVITRDGCPSYVAVNANEYENGAIVNSLLDNQGYGIPPKTARIFELDADPGNNTAGDVQIDCN